MGTNGDNSRDIWLEGWEKEWDRGESVGGSLGTDGAISGGRLPPTECRAIKSFSHVHIYLI